MQRHRVQHDRAEDLVDVEPCLEDPGNESPDRPAKEACDHRGGNEEPSRPRGECKREPGRRQRAQDDLSLAADVDHVGSERDADSQPDEEQGRCLHEGLGGAEPGPDGAIHQRRVCRQGIGPKDDQQDGPEDQGEYDTQNGQRDIQRDPAPVQGSRASCAKESGRFPGCQD